MGKHAVMSAQEEVKKLKDALNAVAEALRKLAEKNNDNK